MRKKKIIQMINALTVDDFYFSIDTTMRTINPCEDVKVFLLQCINM